MLPVVYILAIGWLYVTALMALTAQNVVGGLMTFIFYGLLPCGLLLWLLGTPQRRRNRRLAVRTEHVSDKPNAEHAATDQ